MICECLLMRRGSFEFSCESSCRHHVSAGRCAGQVESRFRPPHTVRRALVFPSPAGPGCARAPSRTNRAGRYDPAPMTTAAIPRLLVWLLVALLGATALATVALHRGETISSTWF